MRKEKKHEKRNKPNKPNKQQRIKPLVHRHHLPRPLPHHPSLLLFRPHQLRDLRPHPIPIHAHLCFPMAPRHSPRVVHVVRLCSVLFVMIVFLFFNVFSPSSFEISAIVQRSKLDFKLLRINTFNELLSRVFSRNISLSFSSLLHFFIVNCLFSAVMVIIVSFHHAHATSIRVFEI